MNILTCEKVLALLPLYIDGKTNKEQSFDIEQHLNNCPKCSEKYISLKTVAERIKSAFDNIDKKIFCENNIFFEENLSAFIDNELSKEDYFLFNRYVTNNPDAKRSLEEMLTFEEKLQNFLKKDTGLLNNDFSKKVVNEIKQENSEYIWGEYYKAGVLTVLVLVIIILIGYYSFPEHINDFYSIKNQIFHTVLHK